MSICSQRFFSCVYVCSNAMHRQSPFQVHKTSDSIISALSSDMHPMVLRELVNLAKPPLHYISNVMLVEQSSVTRKKETSLLHLKRVEKKTQRTTDWWASPLCLGRLWSRSWQKQYWGTCKTRRWSETSSTSSPRANHYWIIQWPSMMEWQPQFAREDWQMSSM